MYQIQQSRARSIIPRVAADDWLRKTQVAIEFAYRLLEKKTPEVEYSVFWLHASSASRMEQGLKDIATKLGFRALDLLPDIQNWFCGEQSGRWLLIIDNADDEDVFFQPLSASSQEPRRLKLCDFLPKKQGCVILYTSRNKTCAVRLLSRTDPSKIIFIDPMKTDEAVGLVENGLQGTLEKAYIKSIRDYTTKLVEILDRLPLALVQATAMMRENDELVRDPKAYLELYSELEMEQARFLEENFVDWRRDSDLPNSVFLSWKLSFEQLKRRDENAVRLLSLFSILDRQSIPEWLLAFYPEMSRYDRVKALSLLHSFSFIAPRQRNSGSKKWQIHRLVQMATHAWIGPDGLEKFLRIGVRILAEAFMGHIFQIREKDMRLQRSLEYYPHVKGVLSLLRIMGQKTRVESLAVGQEGWYFEDSEEPRQRTDSPLREEPPSLVDEEMEFFAEQIKYKSSSRARQFIQRSFNQIAEGSFEDLEDVVRFLHRRGGGSRDFFRYVGVVPLVSRPVYTASTAATDDRIARDWDPFEEVEVYWKPSNRTSQA